MNGYYTSMPTEVPTIHDDAMHDHGLWASVRALTEAVVTSSPPPDGFVCRPLPLGSGEAEAFAGVADSGRAGGVTVVVVVAPTEERPSRSQIRRRFGLTPREVDVALLLASRRSNKEIAQQLEISPNTAWRHTENVLAKLSIGSRREVGPRLAGSGSGFRN